MIARLAQNRFVQLGVPLLIFVQSAWIAGKYFGPEAGWAVLGVLTAILGTHSVVVWRARKRFGHHAQEAGNALNGRRYLDAIQASDEAMAIARRWKFRPDDPLAILFLVRSRALHKSGKHDEALAASAQALGCFSGVKVAGTQLAILDQTGSILLEMGHERRAVPVLEAAMKIGKQVDHDPIRTFGRLERIGMAYLRVGVHANAVAAFAKAVEILTKVKGSDSVLLAGPYVNLGNGYKRMQKLEDAERCYREALRLRELTPSENPEQLSVAMLNVGVVCAESGRHEEAERYYHQVLQLRIQHLGRNHWRVGNTYNNLAGCRRRVRDFGGAELFIQRAIEILEVRPESLCNAMESLSRIREDQGRMEEALAATTRAREIQQSLPTPDLSEMATLHDREALLASRCGEEERARDARARAAKIRQALAAAPPVDRDLTDVSDSLRALEKHLGSTMERVKGLQMAL